ISSAFFGLAAAVGAEVFFDWHPSASKRRASAIRPMCPKDFMKPLLPKRYTFRVSFRFRKCYGLRFFSRTVTVFAPAGPERCRSELSWRALQIGKPLSRFRRVKFQMIL